ncbi:MAG: ATP-binding cassette domain-containing protein [Cellulomonas sp.]|uniref:ATP-binding cassette domain-containing protein n=1 Tax=Cellulomonas sp. 73-92 TaxID=1895740 RepID=UPI00092ADBF1|nr:ATP-binding cassette domain-containing protein [Cellulomonas sp. 73-92]MBN9374837.1 ATP-binding cassette domain-containing protein [Cellulomonas sp.]OJV80419.1 MAG: daunorubicin/doxorubicin resistance ABC transporter ATP-binding protein DrrA [Cellulomonas sp. 73-92]
MNAPAIEARGLVKVFGANRAVDGVDLDVATGAIYGVLGPNGAGKTTTIKMLATLLSPDAGSARVLGHDVVREAHTVRSLVGLTGQYASVDEDLSARENLVLFGRLLGLGIRGAKTKADALLDEFSLVDAATRPLKKFSGGMRRRLDLAASLIAQPPLIFLDEPTTGLDPRTRLQMWDTIRRLVAEGSTVLLTTQYLDEADQLADRIAVIDRGRVVAEGTADDLKRSVGTQSLHLTVASHGPHDGGTGPVAATRRAIREITGQEPVLTPVSDGARLTAPLDSAAAVSELLVRLRTSGVEVRELSMSRPTLDEVFLALTGHGAQDAETPVLEEVHA